MKHEHIHKIETYPQESHRQVRETETCTQITMKKRTPNTFSRSHASIECFYRSMGEPGRGDGRDRWWVDRDVAQRGYHLRWAVSGQEPFLADSFASLRLRKKGKMYLKNSKIAPLDWYILVLGSCVKSTLWRELNDRFQDYTYSIEMRGGRTLMNFCCRNGPKYIVS